MPPLEPTTIERKCAAPVNDSRYEAVVEVISTLLERGFETYLVGGCVRDMAIGRHAKDYDVATAATPQQIEEIFVKTIAIGKAFGVMQVASRGIYFEVATFRKDLDYRDGRRPQGVTFCDEKEDVLRRDYTINGLLYDVRSELIVDYVGGLADLDRKIVRAIGVASERFEEDHLRILRAIRFSVQLGFDIETETWTSLCSFSNHLAKISRERIRDEFLKMLASEQSSRALEMLYESGCLNFVLPHTEVVMNKANFSSVLSRLNCLPKVVLEDRVMALVSALLFDLVEWNKNSLEQLIETEGGRKSLARKFPDLERCVSTLRLSRHEEQRVRATAVAGRAALKHANDELEDHVWLRLSRWPGALDGFAMASAFSSREAVEEIHERFGALSDAKRNPVPLINGQDLQSNGFVVGPQFKEILFSVENAQLNGAIHSKEEALELARKIASK
jgi:poly(A) polymerase